MTCSATTFSAELAPPSGYHYPHPQHLYSGGGGYQPTATPSQLQQGMAPLYSHVVSFKHNDHFPGLAFHHDSYLRPTLFLYLAICRDMNRVAIVGGQNE